MKKPSLKQKTKLWKLSLGIIPVALIGAGLIYYSFAATDSHFIEPETSTVSGNINIVNDSTASGGKYVDFSACTSISCATQNTQAYKDNLALIKSATIRNRNQDSSPDINKPMDQIVLTDHYGPRSEYSNFPGGNPEDDFPFASTGIFRLTCEFSHFSYDDPIVYPQQPGAAHLHMYWGNTDVNAYSTYDSLFNNGASSCNGGELNRTGYWAPAIIDKNGNARIPMRINVYYKGEGLAAGKSEVYPDKLAIVADGTINNGMSGAGDIASFLCITQYGGGRYNYSNTIPLCADSATQYIDVLEMNIKFPNCWNGNDPTNYKQNLSISSYGGWYASACNSPFSRTFPNLEYRIWYPLSPGETTDGWYLSSDINKTNFTLNGTPGTTVHADWWGAWNKTINKTWIDNCTNIKGVTCGHGFLTGAGITSNEPALKFRKQFDGPYSTPVNQLFNELCKNPGRQYTKPQDAAYCNPR